LKEELKGEEKEQIKNNMKAHLEALVGKVPGLISMQIVIDGLEFSNADVMLDSTLEDEAALKGYAVHPEHVAVADTYVRPFTAVRTCMDYEV
ncbi:MAG TPA: stress responsive protein, partial [Lachnospiraceae bacterium]|nr:stress responsive protein [Lachnospiraceae bacterium]